VPPSQPESAVIVVSDAPGVLEPVVRALEESGFQVDVYPDGPAALAAYRRHHTLVLLDSTLKMPPHEFVRMLRSRSEVPVIVLTTVDDEDGVVTALEAGADDVVALPAIRRGPVPEAEESVIEVGDVRLDPTGYVVTVEGVRVDMTRKEFELLRVLMTNAGQTVPRRVLVERVWGWETTEGKTLDTHIRRIRAKIESDPSAPARIVTVRKVGYRFNRPRR
jgi:two-component system response regulator RegX3